MKRLLVMVSMIAISAPVLARDCSGEFVGTNGDANTMEMADGSKVTFFSNSGSVSSKDTPYNGTGACTGYVHVKGDGNAFAMATCVRTTESGDAWGYLSFPDATGKKGKWRAVYGTGKFAKNAGSEGWWEITSEDDKGNRGVWGGSCVGL